MRIEMTEQMQQTYANNQHSQCPCCSGAIRGSHMEIDSGIVYQSMYCTECDATWQDEYVFSMVSNLKDDGED